MQLYVPLFLLSLSLFPTFVTLPEIKTLGLTLKDQQDYCRIPCFLESARGRKLEGLWEVLGLSLPLPPREIDPLGVGEPSFRKCA